MRGWSMALAAVGCLYGAAGVALAAAGAHRAGPLATTAAYFLLFHAAAITSLGLYQRPGSNGAVRVAASLIAVGVGLFSGELALHALTGAQPVPLAAPTGGFLMIAGWLMAAVAVPRAITHRN